MDDYTLGGGKMEKQVEKFVLRRAEAGETKCIMILKDGTEFEVPIMRLCGNGKGKGFSK